MPKNSTLDEVMKSAEVNEKKEQKIFKDAIMKRIDAKAKNLDSDVYLPIRNQLNTLLAELQTALDAEYNKQLAEKHTFKRLAKFSKEDIIKYLETLDEEVK